MKNAITWFEVPTQDIERAAKFYSTILGEPINITKEMGDKMGPFPMDKDGDVGGALIPVGKWNSPSGTGTRVYLNCAGKLDEVISRVEAAGGKIVEPKFAIGQWGFISLIEDTEGNVIGLHSM